MPPPQRRTGSICVYVVSCLFFLILISGGAFLLLYIILPESEATTFFPIIGIVLVGVPWAFWILTCIYRAITVRDPRDGPDKWAPPTRTAAPTTPGKTKAPPTSTFDEDDGNGEKDVVSDGKQACHADGSNEGSSLTSHESEAPLKLSTP